jgi:hypothetical protein
MEYRVLEEMATFAEVASGTACTITIPYGMCSSLLKLDIVLNTHRNLRHYTSSGASYAHCPEA